MKTGTKAFKGTRYIGRDAQGLPVYVSILLDDKGELHITGEARGAFDAAYCGQIIEQLEERAGWQALLVPADILDKLLDIWKRWHLNHMQAGCSHQRAAGWVDRRIDPKEVPNNSANRDARGVLAIWVRPSEHKDGLLCKPCPECGYKYGSEWLHEEIPDDVRSWLWAFINNPEKPDEPKDFCEENHIEAHAERVTDNPNMKDDGRDPGRRHFRVILCRYKAANERPALASMRVYFSQGSAHKKAPTAQDVIGCLISDARTLEEAHGFDEWADNMGYSMETAKERKAARRTFDLIEEQRDDLREFLGRELFKSAMEAR